MLCQFSGNKTNFLPSGISARKNVDKEMVCKSIGKLTDFQRLQTSSKILSKCTIFPIFLLICLTRKKGQQKRKR